MTEDNYNPQIAHPRFMNCEPEEAFLVNSRLVPAGDPSMYSTNSCELLYFKDKGICFDNEGENFIDIRVI